VLHSGQDDAILFLETDYPDHEQYSGQGQSGGVHEVDLGVDQQELQQLRDRLGLEIVVSEQTLQQLL
jgi:hypothetical protein